MKDRILAIIPARKNSKRIKNKNLKKLGNYPLIYYSIKYALKSNLIDRVIVSTDSNKIRNYSNKFGNLSPFLRPKKLSGDKVSDTPVIKHACQWLEMNEKFNPSIVVILRPTTPFRKKSLLEKCIKKLKNNSYSSIRSARYVGHNHPFWMYKMSKNGGIKEFIKGKNFFKYYQSQKLPNLVKHDGYCDVILRKNFNLNKRRDSLHELYGSKMNYIINDDKYFVNIDEIEDFEIAKKLLKR